MILGNNNNVTLPIKTPRAKCLKNSMFTFLASQKWWSRQRNSISCHTYFIFNLHANCSINIHVCLLSKACTGVWTQAMLSQYFRIKFFFQCVFYLYALPSDTLSFDHWPQKKKEVINRIEGLVVNLFNQIFYCTNVRWFQFGTPTPFNFRMIMFFKFAAPCESYQELK